MQLRVQKTIQGFRDGLISEEVALERLQDWLTNFDEVLRADSIEGLVAVGGSGAAAILVDFLGRCAWRDSKLDTIRALGHFRGEECLIPVLAQPCFDRDIEIAQEAILALGSLGLKGVVEVLVHVLEHEPPQKKLQTVYSLGKIGSPRAVPALLKELEGAGESNPLLTETLLLSLTDLRSHEAVEAMRAYVRSLIPGIRHSAVTGLGKLARPDEGIEKLLVPLVDDPDVLTGNLASWALFTIKTRAQREPWVIVDDIVTEEEPALRLPLIRDLRLCDETLVLKYLRGQRLPSVELLEILYELETAAALRAMVDVLVSTPEEQVQFEAARLLSHVGIGREDSRISTVDIEQPTQTGLAGLVHVVRALGCGDRAPDVLLHEADLSSLGRADIMWIFRGLRRLIAETRHDGERMAVLLDCLTTVLAREHDSDVLRAATACMGELTAGPAAAAALSGLQVIADRDDVDAEWRYRALACIGTPEAAAELVDALYEEEDPSLLDLLVSVLGRIAPKDMAPRIINRCRQLLAGSSVAVIERCIQTIGRLGSPAGVPAIVPFLEADDYRLVQAAVIALGSIGAIDAVPALGELLHGSDRRILGRTLHALSQIGGDQATHLLLDFIASHPWDDEFGDKVLRSVTVPKPGSATACIELLETFEERTSSLTLREGANSFKLAILESTFKQHPLAQKECRKEETAAVTEEGALDKDAGIEARMALARTLLDAAAGEAPGSPAICFALSQCCRALDEATELGLAEPFATMRHERVVYTILENIGFAGTRSNAIDRSFFLDMLHNVTELKSLRRFPDDVLEDILNILYKNQLHRNLLLKGFQRWALILLVFGREYYLERFKIPNLLGIPDHLDHLKIRICTALIGLDDCKLAITARLGQLTHGQVSAFLATTEAILKDLATLFRWHERG